MSFYFDDSTLQPCGGAKYSALVQRYGGTIRESSGADYTVINIEDDKSDPNDPTILWLYEVVDLILQRTNDIKDLPPPSHGNEGANTAEVAVVDLGSDSEDEDSIENGDVDPPNATNELKAELYHCLTASNLSGPFATYGMVDGAANPGLIVRGLGTARLPLSERDAVALLRMKGVGTTKLAKEARFEIDEFSLENPAWALAVSKLLERIAQDLVLQGSNLPKASLAHLRLIGQSESSVSCEEDVMQSDRTTNLRLCLPSAHTGGKRRMIFQDETHLHDTESTSKFETSFAAWHADVHETCSPITSGYKLELCYNMSEDPGLADAPVEQTASRLIANKQNSRKSSIAGPVCRH